jgi:AAA+ ATPase superfamily predicted ATPase
MNIEEIWEKAIREDSPDPNGAVGELINLWAKSLQSEVVWDRREENTAIFFIDLSNLMLRGLDTNILMVVHPAGNPEEEKKIYELLEYSAVKATAAHCLCFVVFLEEKARIAKDLHPELIDIVVLDGESVKKQFKSGAPEKILFDIILKQVNIARLCPFDTTRPARGDMFVGRRDEIRSLVQDIETSFLVTGSRRVGKSSLLLKASEILMKHDEYKDRVHLMYCETLSAFNESASHIVNLIDPKKERKALRNPQNLLRFFKVKSKYGEKPLILFFDEFDRITDFESKNDWQLLRCLQNAVEKKYIRVTFAGYRSVLQLNENNDSPFHQKLKFIKLPPLEEKDSFSLFILPFQRIGIKIVDPDFVSKKILHFSGGYPYVIQFYGEGLFEQIVRKETQELKPEDIFTFEESFAYNEYIIGHFLENTEKNERLLAILYAFSEDTNPWSEEDFRREIFTNGLHLNIEDIHKAARNLVLANIFEFQNSKFAFIFPIFREQIRKQWKSMEIKKAFESGGF